MADPQDAEPKTDIGKIFATDPLKLTRSNITAMIKVFRDSRHRFNLGVKGAGSAKALTPAKQEAADATKGISLSDLGLDI